MHLKLIVFVTTCKSRYGGTVYDSIQHVLLFYFLLEAFLWRWDLQHWAHAHLATKGLTRSVSRRTDESCAKKTKFESSKRFCKLKFKKSCQGRHGWHYGHYNPADSSFLSIKHRSHAIFRFKHFRTQASAFTPWQHVWCRDAPCGPNELLRRNESCSFPWIARWSSMGLRF